MALVKSWEEGRTIELMDCPFCGGTPKISHIGNEYTKKRKVEIKCTQCRISRVNAGIIHPMIWIENISVEQWNQRVIEQ